jgi:hypothetical protein
LRRAEDTGAPIQLDTGLNPSGWSVSSAGDRALGITRVSAAGGARATIYSIGGTGAVTTRFIEGGVLDAQLEPGGTFAVYQKAALLKRVDAAAGAAPIELTAGIKSILSLSPDTKYAATNKLDDVMGASDIQLSATAAAAAPSALVATAVGIPVGFTDNGSHFLFIPDQAAPKLMAHPVAGGTDVDLGAVIGLLAVPGTSKLILRNNKRDVMVGAAKVPVYDYVQVNLGAAAAAPVTVLTGVLAGAKVLKTKIVFSEATGSLFVKDLP